MALHGLLLPAILRARMFALVVRRDAKKNEDGAEERQIRSKKNLVRRRRLDDMRAREAMAVRSSKSTACHRFAEMRAVTSK